MNALRSLSLRWKIPALIALLIFLAVGAFGFLGYATIRRSALDAALSHQRAAASQVAELLVNSARNLQRQLAAGAAHPALVALYRTPDAPLSDSARAVLQRLAPDTSATVGVRLLDRRGRSVLSRGPERAREGPIEWAAPSDSAAVSPFYVHGDRVAFEVSVPVQHEGRHLGHLVQLRIVRSGTTNTAAIEELIGSEATLLFGNVDGSLWTNLAEIVRGPVAPQPGRYTREGRALLGASASIEGTPWSIAVETPESAALAPVRALVRRFSLAGFAILLIGTLLGERLSRGMTRPLEQLTASAEGIAGGDLEPLQVGTDRSDEIGRLGRSFAAMADSVRQARDHLETKIGVRTAELETALTQLREAQEELVRKERLAMLGQLSSSIGHELRNPLGVMLNAVYFLEMTLRDAPPKAREYLRLVREQIRLSERIVSDLLDSARTRPPQRAALSVHDVVSECSQRVPVPASIRMERDMPPDLPALYADPDQLGQILVNLFTNAVQAMDGREGTLTVRARQYDSRVRIEVQDTGDGVPEEHRDKIFEPLFTTKARGIGLGLSVSRSLAQANSGDLSVANHSGGGAVFRLDLPVSEQV